MHIPLNPASPLLGVHLKDNISQVGCGGREIHVRMTLVVTNDGEKLASILRLDACVLLVGL